MESLRKSHRDDLSRVQRVACHTRMMFPMEKKPQNFCLGGRCFLVEAKTGQPYAYHSCMVFLPIFTIRINPVYIGKYAIICVLWGMIFHEFPS